MAHGGEECVNAGFEGGQRDLVNEFFSLDSALVVVGEEDFDDGVELEVHHVI
jgi:hypothetical protein